MKKLLSSIIFSVIFLIILVFNIYGQTGWVQQNSGTTGSIVYIEPVDQNVVFAGAPSMKTTNGGINWFLVASQPGSLNLDMVNSNTGYAVSGSDSAFKTTNGGINWVNVTPFGNPRETHVSFFDDQTGYVGGLQIYFNLYAYRTTNGGVNWSSLDIASAPEFPNNLTIYDIKAVTAGTVYVSHIVWYIDISGHDQIGYFLKRSTNGGTNFNTMMSSDTLAFGEMSFPSATTGYIIANGNSGVRSIIKSVNDNWGANVCFRTTFVINSIDFPTNDIGYAVCEGGIIYKTTNGGVNWLTINSGTTVTLRDVHFINSETGWAVGDGGVILKTTTGGVEPVLHSVSGTIRFQDNNNPVTSGYVKALRYDSASYSIITVDSAQIQSNGAYTLPHCPPVQIDIMAYENDEEELSFAPTYYVSTINWQSSTHVRPDSDLTNINIAVKRITNPGDSYHVSGYIYSNNSYDYTSVKNAVIYSRTAGVFKSYAISLANGFYEVDSLLSGVYELIVDRMGYLGDTYVISITNSSLDNVNFYLDNLLVPVRIPEINVPDRFNLEQNYPNPFNPSTKIRFSVPVSQNSGNRNVQLVIYDVVGRKVATLQNEEFQPGTYEVTWDAANYSSGIYFYQLVSGDFRETRKMVLMK